jgi:hypothetical protein
MVEGLQEQDVQGAASINKDSVELDILDDGANSERVLTWLLDKILIVTMVESDGDLRPLQVLEGGGRDCQYLLGSDFCFLLDS